MRNIMLQIYDFCGMSASFLTWLYLSNRLGFSHLVLISDVFIKLVHGSSQTKYLKCGKIY